MADQAEFQSIEGKYHEYSGFSEYDNKDLADAYAYAQTKSEYSEVDAAVVTLYPTMKQLMEKMDEAFAYGEQKSYLDDDFAKAMELHAEIYPLLDTYYAQEKDFVSKFATLSAAEKEKGLQALKDKGHDLSYTMDKVLSIRVKDNNPPTETDMLIPGADSGTFEGYNSVYGDLVDDYNNAIEWS